MIKAKIVATEQGASGSKVALEGVKLTAGKTLLCRRRWLPIAVEALLLLFVTATFWLVLHSSDFISDDFIHFYDVVTRSFFDLLRTPIDVHFAPLHQLASFLIFTIAPLNFTVALAVLVASWIASIVIVNHLLRRLTSTRSAWLITVLFGASPAWFHALTWWSGGIHRLPYLLLQAAAFLSYYRYRENGSGRNALLCAALQLVAVGFFAKAILFPLMLIAFEICLALEPRRLSRVGLKLCAGMAIISALYLAWYFVFAPVVHAPYGLGKIDTILYSLQFISRLGSLLLFLPIDQSWSAWLSGAFWLALASWSIMRSPRSMLPIVVLLALLLISFSLTLAGRGVWATSPFGSMRYYSEELVVIAIFVALAAASHTSGVKPSQSGSLQGYLLALPLMLAITYPVVSYYYNYSTITKASYRSRIAHNFLFNLHRSMKEVSVLPPPIKIARRDFPAFGSRLVKVDGNQVSAVLGRTYPQIEWVQPDVIQENMYHIRDDGFIEKLTVGQSINFTK